MSTVFAGIVGAIVSTLTAAPAVSAQIYRARLRPLAAQHTSAVVVRVLNANPQPAAIKGAPLDFVTQIAVECYARTNTTTPDLAADTLLAAAYTRIMADTTLGGLVADVMLTGLTYDFDADADQLACITLTLEVLHRTANLTLE